MVISFPECAGLIVNSAATVLVAFPDRLNRPFLKPRACIKVDKHVDRCRHKRHHGSLVNTVKWIDIGNSEDVNYHCPKTAGNIFYDSMDVLLIIGVMYDEDEGQEGAGESREQSRPG